MTSISKIALNNTEYNLEDTSARSSLDNLATVATSGSYNDLTNKPTVYHPDLLSFQWSDHLLNNVSWLRADTFSWQDGTVYEAAYEHLTDDITGITPTTETIGSNTITVYVATDGHKIVLADQAQTVQDIYDETGIAWYFILDTTNQRFKLPRTKFGFTGLRNTAGKYVEAGLPNITGTQVFVTYGAAKGTSSGAFTNSKSNSYANCDGGGGAYGNSTDLVLDASRSNPIYGNSSSVQPPATEMYLYFYVGDYTQEAIEQTAGITSEQLNAKVDISSLSECQVIIETYVNGDSWYRVWSDGWCEQGGAWGSNVSGWSEASVIFLKPFSNTNYQLFVQGNWSDAASSSCKVTARSTTGFTGTYANNLYSVMPSWWYACGYI